MARLVKFPSCKCTFLVRIPYYPWFLYCWDRTNVVCLARILEFNCTGFLQVICTLQIIECFSFKPQIIWEMSIVLFSSTGRSTSRGWLNFTSLSFPLAYHVYIYPGYGSDFLHTVHLQAKFFTMQYVYCVENICVYNLYTKNNHTCTAWTSIALTHMSASC